MPRKFHQLSKRPTGRRERRLTPRSPQTPAAATAAGTLAPSPVPQPTAGPVAGEPTAAGRESAPIRTSQAAAPVVAARLSPKSTVYLTQEGKHLGREFRNIMILTLAMATVIVVLSFFLR